VSVDPERLRRALGAQAVEGGPDAEVDGLKVPLAVRPCDGAALVEVLRVLQAEGAAGLVRGGGTRLGVGNPPRCGDVLLHTTALAGIRELDGDEGVACVGAGTPLSELATAADEAGWELPLASPGEAATVGGCIASAAIAPRVLCYGRPRDHVLGLRVAHPSGERSTCGGRVVKNVTGYDLMKLHTGAFGSLGVVEEAWVRLRPRPEERSVGYAWLPDSAAGFARGMGAAALPSARVVALVDPALAGRVVEGGPVGGCWLLVAELGGAAATLADDRVRLAEDLDVRSGDDATLARLTALQEGPRSEEGLRFRLAVRPARLAAAAAPLVHAGAVVMAWPGTPFLYAGFPLFDGADELTVDDAIRAARAGARAGGGSLLLEAAPAWAKRGRDVFGEPPSAFAVMRAVKKRFDPHGVLNPGRFVGGI
jgi:glycolate oxidase FAD binding subunit